MQDVLEFIIDLLFKILKIKSDIPTISDTKVAIIFIIVGTPILVMVGILAIISKNKRPHH